MTPAPATDNFEPVIDVIHAINACRDDAALVALLPWVRARLPGLSRVKALALVVNVIEQVREVRTLDGPVRELIGEATPLLKPGQQAQISRARQDQRQAIARDERAQLKWG